MDKDGLFAKADTYLWSPSLHPDTSTQSKRISESPDGSIAKDSGLMLMLFFLLNVQFGYIKMEKLK